MDFLKHQSESTSWEELQEPVPFEDFKFSFGLDPDFSIPLPSLDTTSTSTSSTLSSADPMLSDEIFPSFDLYSQPPPLNNMVLDEQDQKTFSNFLDTFFMDLSNNTLFDTHPSPSSNYFMPPLQDDDYEERRRNSILQSLDHQKQKLHGRLNLLAAPSKKRTMTSSSASQKKHKSEHKELLTEEEKRANHIASEQKRRSTIRTGFKDLTEIIPTLKNIHHSKSTVLFKAVDYIKRLDRRNKLKREKLQQLQRRLERQQQMPPVSTGVTAALKAHKSQQAQLLQLQEQLQLHQRLLARQQSLQEPPKAGFRAVMHDDDDPFFKPTLSA